jgi:hypothetical protein
MDLKTTTDLPGVKSGQRVWLTTLPPSMIRISENVGASTFCNPMGLHGLYGDNFTFTYGSQNVIFLLLLEYVLPEFDHYLAIYISSVSQ